MQIDLHIVKDLPVAIIDDFYNKEELKSIWEEICFLSPKLRPTHITGPALDADHNQMTSKTGVFLEEIYAQQHFSNILVTNKKLWHDNILDELINSHYFFRFIPQSNFDSTLISRYVQNDYYEAHIDQSCISAITWFCREPKQFSGGELVIEDLEIETKNNRLVLFPGILGHQVKPVQMTSTDMLDGRFTMTQFIGIY